MGRNSETIRYHRMIDAGENPTEKPCRGCKTWLPLDCFGRERSRKDGLAGLCRPCARARYRAWVDANRERHRETSRRRAAKVPLSQRQDHHRKHRYGMKPGEFDAMRIAQGGHCAVCSRDKKLVVDHDHHTGKVRGLLCYSCNSALHLFDTPGMVDAALRYLGRAGDGTKHLPTETRMGSGMQP